MLVYNVPEEVQPYIDRFQDEAAKRNWDLHLSEIGLDIVFQEDLDGDLAAVCNEGQIVISRQTWNARGDNWREAMIFHELGHCVLHRVHDNDILSNDEWQSLMRGGPVQTDRTISLNYSGVRRAYYIDELFNQQVSEPDWVGVNDVYELPEGTRDTIFQRSSTGSLASSLRLPDSVDFEMEALIDIQNSTTHVGLAWGGTQIQDEIVVHYNAAKTFVINAGLGDQSVIYERTNFEPLDEVSNLISVRKRGDKYYIFVNRQFVYWMDVKLPFVNRLRVLANDANPRIFKEILIHTLE